MTRVLVRFDHFLVRNGWSWPLVSRRSMGLITRNWERKRFYKNVSVYEEESDSTTSKYGVKLDHRLLRTPLRHPFLVPSEALALAVAQEWESQGNLVQLPLMHLTALCNTVIDNARGNNGVEEKERCGGVSEHDVEPLMDYIATDTLCYRVTEPDDLVARQNQEWGPVVDWFEKRFHCEVPVTTDHYLAPSSTPSLSSSSSSAPKSSDSLVSFMTRMNRWSWTGFKYAVDSCSSLILACALHEGLVNSTQASDLARLEARYQVLRWGEVEWYHSVEEADLKSRLSAAVLLKELTSN